MRAVAAPGTCCDVRCRDNVGAHMGVLDMRSHQMMRGARAAAILVSAILFLGVGCSDDGKLKVNRLSRDVGSSGDTINIYGSGFQSGGRKDVRVFFGTKKADVLGFKGDTQMTVKVPGGVDFGKTVDIKLVFEPGGQLSMPHAFTYAKPEIGDPNELLGGGKKKK